MGLVLAFLLVLMALMALGWRARKRRQSHVPRPNSVPAELGAVIAVFEGLYLSTTVGGEPLNRIAVRGLGFRAKALITVAERGLVVDLRGGDEVFIPRSDLRGVARANLTIDRVVETGGLVRIDWTLGGNDVDSYLRVDDPQALRNAIDQLTASATSGGAQ